MEILQNFVAFSEYMNFILSDPVFNIYFDFFCDYFVKNDKKMLCPIEIPKAFDPIVGPAHWSWPNGLMVNLNDIPMGDSHLPISSKTS